MCKCLEIQAEGVKKHLLTKYEVNSVNYVLITQSMAEHPQVGIQAIVSMELLTKKNTLKHKESTMVLVAVYCPWCGIKYQENAKHN
jgi:hypothetical protein